jgi:hypothetical protein
VAVKRLWILGRYDRRGMVPAILLSSLMLGRHTAAIPQEIESSGAERNTLHEDKVIPI